MANLSNINDLFEVESTGAIKFSNQSGTSGQVLKSNGNAAPTWVDASTVIGGPYLPLTGGTLTGNLAINGSNSLTVGGALSGSTATFAGTGTFTDAVTVTGSYPGLVLDNPSNTRFALTNRHTDNRMSFDVKLQGGSTVEVMNLKSTGLGIGTDSPGQYKPATGVVKLDVKSGDIIRSGFNNPANSWIGFTSLPGYAANSYPSVTSKSSLHFANNDKYCAFLEGTDTYFGVLNSALSTKIFLATGSQNSYLAGSGNVGIGTTSPTLKLDVASTNFGLPATSGTTPVGFQRWGYTSRSWGGNEILMGIINAGNYPGFIQCKVPTDYSGTRPFLINPQGGNVGIGTDSPTSKLDILDAVDRVMNASGHGQFEITGNGYTFGIAMGATTTSLYHNSSIRSLSLGTNETERLTILGNGDATFKTANCKVGIGTTSLGSISGGCSTMTFGSTAAALSGGIAFQANATSKSFIYWESDNMRYQNVGNFSHTFYRNNSTVLFTIATSGTVTAAGDVVAYSDKKLKKNIKTLDGSKVYKMRGVSFDRIDTGKSSSGVIAQEIQQVAPELIDKSKDGTLGVAYGNLTGYLIEAIKELEARVKELENK